MGIAMALLGAQLSIAGAILYQSHESTGGSDSTGTGMIILGLVLGVVAAFIGRSPNASRSSGSERA